MVGGFLKSNITMSLQRHNYRITLAKAEPCNGFSNFTTDNRTKVLLPQSTDSLLVVSTKLRDRHKKQKCTIF